MTGKSRSRCCYCPDTGLLLGRVPLGLTFLFAGIHKFRGGIGNFVDGASKMIPSFLPHTLGVAYLHALPFAEVAVGVAIVLGILTRVTGLIASLMLISFMIAETGWKANGGPHFNVVFLGMTLLLMLSGAGKFSVDGMCCGKCIKPPAME